MTAMLYDIYCQKISRFCTVYRNVLQILEYYDKIC